jgi:hypothetical protein
MIGWKEFGTKEEANRIELWLKKQKDILAIKRFLKK